MYSKQEASLIRKEFWTSFGQYMRPITNADGEAINWINYKTGVKDIFFRMDADSSFASVGIELHSSDATLREEHFYQFTQLKKILEEETGEEWKWEPDVTDEYGKTFGRISKKLPDVSIFKKSDWPAIISFLKPRIIALDRFWGSVREGFQ